MNLEHNAGILRFFSILSSVIIGRVAEHIECYNISVYINMIYHVVVLLLLRFPIPPVTTIWSKKEWVNFLKIEQIII